NEHNQQQRIDIQIQYTKTRIHDVLKDNEIHPVLKPEPGDDALQSPFIVRLAASDDHIMEIGEGIQDRRQSCKYHFISLTGKQIRDCAQKWRIPWDAQPVPRLYAIVQVGNTSKIKPAIERPYPLLQHSSRCQGI